MTTIDIAGARPAQLSRHRPLTGSIEDRFDEIVERFDARPSEADRANAGCPCCDHSTALSMSISDDRSRILVKCHAGDHDEADGCETAEVLALRGLRFSDLFVNTPTPQKPRDLSRLVDGEKATWLRPAVFDVVLETTDLPPSRAQGAALLLQEIASWMPYAKVIRDGRYWVARTAHQIKDRTTLTKNQLAGASDAPSLADALVEAGLIEKRLFRFAGSPTNHYSLNEEVFERLHLEAVADRARRRAPDE